MNLKKSWNKFFYRNPKGKVNNYTVWKQQNEQAKNNDVYKMVDFGGGGAFLDVWNLNGEKESDAEKTKRFQEYFEKEIKPFYLYDECTMITEKEYQAFHNTMSKKIKTMIKQKENNETVTDFGDDGISQYSEATLETLVLPFIEHTVKWRIDKRGAVGETPMHLLFLINTPRHIKIAKAILAIYPELSIDIYEGFEYYGESCLHLAIIQQNVKAVRLLLNTGELVEKYCHSRARGRFFQPLSIKRGDVKLKKQKFEGYAYYGEYPLSFAASTGNHEIYDLLIKHKCNPTLTDKFGNNVLHLTVIHNQPDLYYYAVKHAVHKADPNQTNNEGLTPLALAAKLGRKEMFEKILEISSREHWSYNTVTCSVYPLKSLDTIGPKGETDWNSALMMIIRGNKQGHYDMVANDVVHQLLQEKWKTFAKAKFIRLLVFYLFHIALLFPAVYLRPNAQADLRYGTSSYDIARYVFEVMVLIVSTGVLFYVSREIYLETLYGFIQNLIAIPSRVVYVLSNILIVLCVPFRFAELYSVEDWLLVFAIPGLWSYLLFFFRSIPQFGPLIIMIYRILASDMFRFVYIYVVIVFTSTVAFFYQFQGQNIFAFQSAPGTAMTLFQMTFGELSYQDVLSAKLPGLSIVLFVIFMVLVHILLLNMLIAMMTRTFDKITAKSRKVWKQQWAAMVITMERSHRQAQKREFQQSYDMNINTARVSSEGAAAGEEDINTNIKYDERAIMVIKQRQTSETGRRRIIQQSWKNVGEKALTIKPSAAVAPPQLEIRSVAGMTDFMLGGSHNETFDDENDEGELEEEEKISAVKSFLQKSFSRRGSAASYTSPEASPRLGKGDIV